MNILKKTNGIDLRAKDSALRGNVTIQLKDAVTGHVKNEISGHNMLTNGLNSALNGCPFQLNVVDSAYGAVLTGTQRMKMTPIFSQLLGGVMLFPEPLGDDRDLFFPSFDNSPTAFASMESYTQDDPRQGLFDAVASKPIDNAYRYIYEWGSSYGNGFISSLGLSTRNCHTWVKKRANLFRPWNNNQGGFTSQNSSDAFVRFVHISERGTIICRGTATYTGYNTFYYFKRLTPIVANLLGDTSFNFDLNNPYDANHLNGYDWKITVSDMNDGNLVYANIQNVNDELLFVYRVNGTGAVKIKKVNWSDGSTISDSTLNPQGVNYGTNSIPVIFGNYMYIAANRDGLIYRCNINDNADVFDIEAPGCKANTHLWASGTQFIYNNNGILDATSAKFEATDDEIVITNNGSSVPVADFGMWHLGRVNNYQLGATLKTWGLMSHFDLGQTFEKSAQQTMTVQYTVTQV